MALIKTLNATGPHLKSIQGQILISEGWRAVRYLPWRDEVVMARGLGYVWLKFIENLKDWWFYQSVKIRSYSRQIHQDRAPFYRKIF